MSAKYFVSDIQLHTWSSFRFFVGINPTKLWIPSTNPKVHFNRCGNISQWGRAEAGSGSGWHLTCDRCGYQRIHLKVTRFVAIPGPVTILRAKKRNSNVNVNGTDAVASLTTLSYKEQKLQTVWRGERCVGGVEERKMSEQHSKSCRMSRKHRRSTGTKTAGCGLRIGRIMGAARVGIFNARKIRIGAGIECRSAELLRQPSINGCPLRSRRLAICPFTEWISDLVD